MSKEKEEYICNNCNAKTYKWSGCCSHCKQWNTIIEEHKYIQSNKIIPSIVSISDIKKSEHQKFTLKNKEISKAFGNGIVKSSITLISGKPGVGKSSLILEIIKKIIIEGKIIYISGEETLEQIGARTNRLGVKDKDLYFVNENNWNAIKDIIKYHVPKLLVIDSIQTLHSEEIGGSRGSVSQVKEITNELVEITKAKGITCLIVSHVTKDGLVAGPKLLEHMVDTVIDFEKNKNNNIRTLRVLKNRFGSTERIGLLEMNYNGLTEKEETFAYLDKIKSKVGCALSVVSEAEKNFLVRIECLTVKVNGTYGKRIIQGYEQTRVSILLAIIEKELSMNLNYFDIYMTVNSEIENKSKSLDLAIIMAIISSIKNRVLGKSIYVGEVTLSGEVNRPEFDINALKSIELKGFEVITDKKINYINKISNHLDNMLR